MPTECSPGLFDFARIEGRAMVAGFDGGAVTSDTGVLLLGATGRSIGLVGRFAACFRAPRRHGGRRVRGGHPLRKAHRQPPHHG
jgi:hypothetical protein